MVAEEGTYGGGTYGEGLYGGGLPDMPARLTRVAFDRDAYALGGIITGTTSTCESLEGWSAYQHCEIDLNINSAWCYAGTGSIKITADGEGDAEVAAFGLGTDGSITSGRTYLLWVHVRPTTRQRDIRVELLWKSATDVFLTAAYSVRTELAVGWTKIGVLATAPPAARRLDIGVDVLGPEAGEVHYLDAVTVEDAGQDISEHVASWRYTLSGRNARFGQTEAGSATVLLGNEHGWFTPGRAATVEAPFGGNIVPRRRVWLLARYAGILYPVWSGYTQRWTQTIPGSQARASEVELECVDAFRWLTAALVPPPYRAEIIASGPLSYFPLDEPGESAYAGDLIAGYPAALVTAAGGDGGSAFGAPSALPVLLSGATSDSGSTSLGLHQDDDVLTTNQGAVLDLRFAGGMPPQLDLAPWSLELWIVPPLGPPTGTAQVIYHQIVPSGGVDYLSGFMLTIELSGQLQLRTGGAEVVATTPGSVCDGRGHLVTVTYRPGGAHGIAELWHNSVLAGELELTTTPMPVGIPQVAQLGGALHTLTGAITYRFTGRAGHVAHYYRQLLADEIAAHYRAGADGHHLETETDRLHAIARYAGWPLEDTRFDRGLTTLLPRDWSTSNPLTLGQDAARTAGSVTVIDAAGWWRYPHRYRWVNTVPVRADFRASYGTEPESVDFQPWLDDDEVINVYTVTRIAGASISVRDQASIDRYGLSEGETVALGAASDDESLIQAQWKLARTAEPRTRVDTVRLDPASAAPLMWPTVLPLEFGDRIMIGDLPETAPAPEIDALIGQIEGEWTAETWSLLFRLEHAQLDTMLVAGDPIYGYLGFPAGY
ncbi:hypothetical protein BBK14_01770 [Parafrankia soli]|uniref:CBM-cenC domain-containing protein n=1 Tax=Parafrankia soli TaxID=2599596 RepID=A0A1S1RK36_9ACTN|nr:hypothetical protein [Parafrankia soli]OHV46600.1 hypothetical protein BBK14_01770 [Parafrankia soli]